LSSSTIYTASRIFTGDHWLEHHAVITANGLITDVVPLGSLSSSQQVKQFDNGILVPSFIDLQIYGAYGKLLSVFPETDSLVKLNEYCEKGGAAFCMPTAATNTKEVFFRCIDAVKY
jgi:N-acetylglucosamine-6-phosphate deacetylase